jgi:hypothetical protein
MRTVQHWREILTAAWLALLMAAPCRAACEWGGVTTASEARQRLEAFGLDGCLRAPACGFPLCRKVAGLRHLSGDQAAEMLREIADSLRTELPADYPGTRPMGEQLSAWIEKVRQTPVDRLPVGTWGVEKRTLFADTDDEVGFGDAIGARMASLHTTAHAEFVLAATQMRMAVLVDQTLQILMEPTRDAYRKRLEMLDRRWQSYLHDSRSSYPWEWLANDLVFGRKQEDGFEEPRTQQLLIAHPDVALQYATFGGDRLSEALTLEVLGFASYRWGRDDKLKLRWGGSAFVGWRGDTNETPYWGLIAHFAHGGAFGVGYRSSAGVAEWSVFASGDVGKLFLKDGEGRAELVRSELLKLASPVP